MKKFIGAFILFLAVFFPLYSIHAQDNQCASYSGFPIANLRRGSTNTEANKQLQCALINQGLMTPADVGYFADGGGFGTYGPKTAAAVLQLQQQLKQIDSNFDYSSGPGIYGPRTEREVEEQIASAPNSYDLTSYYLNNVGVASTEPISDDVTKTTFLNGDYEKFSNTTGSSFYDQNNQLIASYSPNGATTNRGPGTLPSELSDLYPPYRVTQPTTQPSSSTTSNPSPCSTINVNSKPFALGDSIAREYQADGNDHDTSNNGLGPEVSNDKGYAQVGAPPSFIANFVPKLTSAQVESIKRDGIAVFSGTNNPYDNLSLQNASAKLIMQVRTTIEDLIKQKGIPPNKIYLSNILNSRPHARYFNPAIENLGTVDFYGKGKINLIHIQDAPSNDGFHPQLSDSQTPSGLKIGLRHAVQNALSASGCGSSQSNPNQATTLPNQNQIPIQDGSNSSGIPYLPANPPAFSGNNSNPYGANPPANSSQPIPPTSNNGNVRPPDPCALQLNNNVTGIVSGEAAGTIRGIKINGGTQAHGNSVTGTFSQYGGPRDSDSGGGLPIINFPNCVLRDPSGPRTPQNLRTDANTYYSAMRWNYLEVPGAHTIDEGKRLLGTSYYLQLYIPGSSHACVNTIPVDYGPSAYLMRSFDLSFGSITALGNSAVSAPDNTRDHPATRIHGRLVSRANTLYGPNNNCPAI